MTDLLYVGPAEGLAALDAVAAPLGVRLYPATPETAPRALATYGGVLDGAVVAGGTAAALAALDAVAPRLPVALLDATAWARRPSGERPGAWAEEALRRALDDLASALDEREAAGERGLHLEQTPGGWAAHRALRLSGVAAPRDAADALRLASAADRWHRSLAAVVSRLSPPVTVRVRYASAGGRVAAGVVVSAEGPTADEATLTLQRTATDLGPTLRAGAAAGGAYTFRDASSEGRFRVPVRPRACVALRPPGADDLVPLFDGAPFGEPWAAGEGVALAEREGAGVALPVVGPTGATGPLLDLLAGLEAPAMVDVAVRPAPLSPDERRTAEALARQATRARAGGAYGGARALGLRAVQLAVEADRAVALEVSVAVEADAVPAALVVEVARAFVGDPASVREVAARAGVRGGLLVVAPAAPAAGLTDRAGPDEAARALRLPAPGASAPGVPSTHPARLQTPEALPEAGALLGHAPDGRAVRVPADTLATHALVCGATGTGKSTLAETLTLELAEAGHGVLVMDPHGTLARRVRDRLPASRRGDLVWVDAGAADHGHRLNLLDYDPHDPASRDRVFSDLYAFFDAWYDMREAGGPMFEAHFRESIRLLLHDPTERHALPALVRMLTDGPYRRLLVELCDREETARFWRDAERRTGDAQIESISPYIYSKVNRLLGGHAVRRLVSSPETTPDMDPRTWLRGGAVVLCTLPVGRMGAEGASVVGSVLLSRLVRAGFARLDRGGEARPFVAVLDEAHRFAQGEEPSVLLAEGRKVGLGLVALTQRLSSLGPSFRAAALANCGLVASLRVGPADAAVLGPTLAPSFRPEDLLALGRGEAAVRLPLPDGQPGRPFLLRVRPPTSPA